MAEHEQAARAMLWQRAAILAGSEVEKLQLPLALEVNSGSFYGLGERLEALAQQILRPLSRIHFGTVNQLLAIAQKELFFAVWQGAHYMALGITEKMLPDTAFTRGLTTPEGYGRQYGWAAALSLVLTETDELPAEAGMRKGTSYAGSLDGDDFGLIISNADMLAAASLVLLKWAATDRHAGKLETAFDWVFDALAARQSSREADPSGTYALAADESGPVTEREIASRFARAGAHASHAEHHAMRDDIYRWCKENSQRFGTIEKATAAVVDLKLVPLEYRTIRGHIATWRKMRAAGRL